MIIKKIHLRETWDCDEEIVDFGEIKQVVQDNMGTLNFITEENLVFEVAEEKPLYRYFGAVQLYEQNNKQNYLCTDPRIIRFCVIWHWIYRNKKIQRKLKDDGEITKVFLRESNKDNLTAEDAQKWLVKNLIYFDPEQKMFKNIKRQKYLVEYGTLIEEPNWNFGK